jgi:hypothetical protein
MKRALIFLRPFLCLPLVMAACSRGPNLHPQDVAHQAQEDCGFVQNTYGERVSWRTNHLPIRFQIHESFPRKYLPALQEAMSFWEGVTGRHLFEMVNTPVGGPVDQKQDGQNVIYWYHDWEANKPSEQARTLIYWVGPQIVEADIRINAKNFKYYTEGPQNATDVHLPSLLIHELGHVLGLKHNDSEASVMATYLPSKMRRMSVTQADLTSVQCEY